MNTYLKQTSSSRITAICLKTVLLATFTFSLLILSGCSSNNRTDEAIKHFISEAENSVEKGDVRNLRNLIAEGYSDASGRTRKELLNYLTYQVLRKRSIHLYISISSITFPNEKTAHVELIAAMTGAPAESKNTILDLQADIYAIHCSLELIDDSWKLSSASWQPAMIDDLFPQ